MVALGGALAVGALALVMQVGILTWLAGNFQFIAYIGWSTFWSVTLVVVGICTHLGCSPSDKFVPGPQPSLPNDWPGGFLCLGQNRQQEPAVVATAIKLGEGTEFC